MDGSSGHRRPWAGLVCLVFLVFGRLGAGEEACRTGCKGASQTFKYAAGTTYKYNYDGKIEISLSSAEGQTTSTEVKAQVLLTQQGDCNQILRLQNVQVLGSNGKKIGAIPDIEKPIRFNFNDGVIDDSICISDGDNQNSINVKRAIASMFQASTKSGYETDVFGRCPTDTSSHKEGNILVISKSRHLNKCSYREHIQQDFLATAFNFDSEIKSSPVLNGDYRANLRVKNGILDQATVTEDYLYVPFSVGKNGAKAQITSKLSFAGTAQENPQAPVTKPRSIIFDNPHPVIAPTSNVQTILNAVKEVAKTVDIVVGESTAKEFVNLLKVVRASKKEDLLTVYNQVRSGVGIGDKEAAKRLFLDALLRSGYGDSVEAVLELLKKNELDETDSKLALMGLNVVRHATEGSLKTAAPLLDSTKLPREFYLAVGNLAGRFCSQHSCENVPVVKELVNKLVSKLGGKITNRDQENTVIYALKALANLHYLDDAVLQKVTGLAQNKNLPSRVRVAALDAYLADPCKNKLRDSALQILKDIQQDSEVRIRAYLAVAQCPNAKAGNAIKTLLEKEPSIQVGGFITSHIRSLRASANPDKALAKQFLGFLPSRHFPIDPRKYSFNGEFSYSVDTLGAASAVESNVIYSQNSWLPRSTSLNVTAQVFGHNFNFLELETRQENLDKLIEHYFGPKGVLRSSSLRELVKQGTMGYEKTFKYIEKKLKEELSRSKRDVTKAEIEHITKQVQIKTNELNKDLDLDLSVKAFGSEVLFLNLNQEAQNLKPEAIIDKIITEMGHGFDKIKGFQETLRKNILFLDAELDYPTSLGFPLRLAVEGSAVVQVKAEGGIDVRKLLNSPENGQLKIKLIPSANIEVSGRLTLDALVVENGLKVVSNLYSSTGSDINLNWDKSSGFDLKFGLPVQEQKLISANHEIVFHSREQAGKETNLPLKFDQVKDFSVCLDQLSTFIGLTFCAEINGPNLGGQQIPVLPFPFSGDAKVLVSIENDDVSEYRVRQVVRGNPPSHAELVLETIGKNGQKKVSLDLQAEYSPEKYVKAVFSSPVKLAGAEARLISTNVEKSLLVKLSNDKDEFSAKVGIAISGSPERAVYKPILEYKTPAGQQPLPVEVQGQIIAERRGDNVKYTFDNVRIKDQERELSINGNVGREDGVVFNDIKLSDGRNWLEVNGRVQVMAELIKFNLKVQNSVNNNVNFNLKGDFKKQEHTYESSILLIHGADLNSKTSVLTITNKLVHKWKNSKDFTFETKNTISYPLLQINGKFELEHTPNSLDYELTAEYGELKLGSELEAKINEKTDGDYNVDFEIWGFDNKLEIKSKRQVLPNDESKVAHSLQVNGKKFAVDGRVKHHIRPNDLNVGADATVSIPTQANPIKVNWALKVNPNEIDAFQKITSGSDSIVDNFLKVNKAGNANGAVKINIKKVLTVNGQLHANNGVGTGEVLIELQTSKRQIKGATTFKIQQPSNYDVSVTVWPAFNKDKNLKVSFSTQTSLNENNLDTKNKLDLLGNSLEVNSKLSKSGDPKNGKFNGEVEVILPNDQYLLVKGNCDHSERDDILNGLSQGSLEYRKNKNTPGKKLSYKGVWKNTNPKEELYDVEYTLSADDSNGKNINTDISLKTSKQGENHVMLFKNKVYGSLIKDHPLETSINTQCNKGVTVQWEVKGSCGSANNVIVKGNYDVSQLSKQSGGLNVQLSSASKVLKTLNLDLQGSVIHSNAPSQLFELEGVVNVFADDDGTHPDAIIDLKSKGNVKFGIKEGEVKSHIAIAKNDPISIDATYNIKDNKQGGSGSVSVNYAAGKVVKVDGSLERLSDHQYKLFTKVQTPVEGYKNAELSVETKRSKDSRVVNSLVQLIVEGKVWKLQSDLTQSDVSPIVDLKFTTPEGKLTEIYARANKVTDRQFGGELKLLNEERQFTFDGGFNVNIENIDNFIIKGNVNSPNLNLNKLNFEAQNKGSSNDRKIQILVKSAGKNLVSGTTSYSAKEENGKFIVEGSGNFKVKEETKSGNFKYILQRLTTTKNGEEGTQASFDAVLGDKAIDSEWKVTNKQFRVQNSYCETKKECAYVEIDSKINSNELSHYNQVLEVNLDLRKLGLSHEFGLKAVTDRKDWQIDHTVDAHFQNQENSKYQYSFYLHPKEAGMSLTTPKRIVLLEAKCNPPKNFKDGGKGSGEIAFYMDKKNNPQKKTSLSWFLDVDPKGTINGETKFTHPGLRKPLSVSVRATRQGTPFNGKLQIVGELDVFAQDNQKVVGTYNAEVGLDNEKTRGSSSETLTIQSKGLGIDILASSIYSLDRNSKVASYEDKLIYKVGQSNYENIVSTKWSPSEITGTVKVLNKVLLQVLHRLQISKEQQIIESEISSYDNNPVISRLEIKQYQTLAYTLGYKRTPNSKLSLDAGFIPGQIADIRADHIKEGSKTNLFFATVKLDDAEFLKSDHKVNSKAIDEAIKKVRNDAQKFFNGVEDISKEWANEAKSEVKQIGELAKKAQPNLQPLRQYYAKELQELKQEILNDKSVKELGEAARKVLGTLTMAVSELFEKLSQLAEQSAQILQQSFASVIESVEKEFIPLLKESASKALNIVKDIMESALDIVLGVVAKVSQIVEQYQPELKEIAVTLSELGQDFGRIIQSLYENVRENVKAFTDRIQTELKASPLIDQIKAQYQQFIKEVIPNGAEAAIQILMDISLTIKEVIPPEFIVKDDINTLLDTINNYVEMKAHNKPVDDLAVFEKIARTIATIFKKLINIATLEGYELPATKIDSSNFIPLSYFETLPRLAAVKFSPLSYLLDQDTAVGEVGKFLLSLITSPRKLLPPFPLYGLVIQGQHIFTFDGKHLTFPGSCNYLLAGDAVNSNFTLAGTYKDGILTGITLADKNDFVTLLKGGQVKLNNAATELPARKSTIAAYRDYEIITLKSLAGVEVVCTPELIGCAVSISGFYHGQLRGLLGNGNSEPFDDFTLPNGKVVTGEGEFGNAYKMTSGCADVKTPHHDHIPENPICNKLFGWGSSLQYCYPFVPTENFKAACAHGLAANVKGTEEAVAKAYVAACNERHIFVRTPESLVKCTNGDKPFSIGDTFSVKLPSKAADIVLIVDTQKENEALYKQLVQPLVADINKELHNKGINDVEYHIITYGGPNQWPSHVTVQGKLTFKNKAPNLKFGENPPEEWAPENYKNPRVAEAVGNIKEALHDISLNTGINNLKAETYWDALHYPFRVNALKSIVVVNSSPCEHSRIPLVQQVVSNLYKDPLISLNLFTPFEQLSIKDPKKSKEIIGFNDQNVFTLSQGKKNPKGTSELHKELNYNDYCVDFTLKNRGNAFVNNNFVENKGEQQKQFVHIAAVNIVDQLINVEQGLDCECKQVNPWVARNVCREVFIKERPSKKV